MTDQTEDRLAEAQRHVAEGEQRVAEQRALIAKLAIDGHNTTAAHTLLETLMQSLAMMRQHLQQILDERTGDAR